MSDMCDVYESTNYVFADKQQPLIIKFKKTHDDAKLPAVNNEQCMTGDSGYDLFAVENIIIKAHSSAVVPVGLTLADITPGWWFRIEPRSGLGFKHSLQPHLGVIDNQYRGDLGVKLYNFSDVETVIEKGKGCAQLVVYKLYQPIIQWAQDVSDTNRGADGFGSSDSK